MPRLDDAAALAANWRTLLLVDAGLGVALVVVGGAVALVRVAPGVLVAVAGAAYVAAVGRRYRRWRRLRDQAGLE